MTTRRLIHAVPWDEDRAAQARAVAEQYQMEIVWDRHHDGYETFIDALDAQGTDSVLHLEDDVEPTTDWDLKVEAVIEQHPDHLIQFFSMRGADVTVGSRWDPGRTFLMAQCFYLPGRLAPAMREYVARWDKRATDPTGWDLAVGDFLAQAHERYWIHVPSLVQHKTWRSVINPRRPRNRTSRTYVA